MRWKRGTVLAAPGPWCWPIALYQAGTLIGTAPLVDTTLSGMNDVDNWLGRSQFAPDEEFQAARPRALARSP